MDSIVETNTPQPANVKSIISTLNTIKAISEDPTPAQTISSISASDNTSTPFSIPLSQQCTLLSSLRTFASQSPHPEVAKAPDFLLISCLHARKADLARSLALCQNYHKFLNKFSYSEHIPNSPILRQILLSGIFIPAGNVTRDGRPVITIRYRLFDPRKYPTADTVRALGFVIEWMLRTMPNAMTHGIVVCEDVAGFSLRNFDLRLTTFFEKAFSSVMPVRIASLNICNPGLIIRALMALFASFFSKKIQSRITLFGKGDEKMFAEVFAPEQNLSFLGLGGSLEWTDEKQRDLTERMVKDAKRWIAEESRGA